MAQTTAGRAAAGRPARGARTARERAREQITAEIKQEARRQLAGQGAQQLSLRAVARELGMVSSAVYRYFPSRDDLLTALIIDAYDALGASAEAAVTALPPGAVRARWCACGHAVRDWARASPHEYALIYGSPVPGYQAPQSTIGPATRAVSVIGVLLADGWAQAADPADAGLSGVRDGPGGPGGPGVSGGPGGPSRGEVPLPGQLTAQAEAVGAVIAPGVPAPVIARALIAWTQLFGMISFELFGQLVGSADPADDFFGYALDQMADLMGLPA